MVEGEGTLDVITSPAAFDAVKSALEAAGFVVDTTLGCIADPCSPLDAVVQQSPAPGKSIPTHGIVDLLVTPPDVEGARALTPDEVQAVRLEQGRCDCFLCSANAISEEGEIVNVDGIGNRVAAMTFGPRKVVVVAGANKIAPDLRAALQRVREVAAPMRAKSLGMETPCAASGRCADCNAPQRICRVTAILHRPPMLTDISVVLVAQPLGY